MRNIFSPHNTVGSKPLATSSSILPVDLPDTVIEPQPLSSSPIDTVDTQVVPVGGSVPKPQPTVLQNPNSPKRSLVSSAIIGTIAVFLIFALGLVGVLFAINKNNQKGTVSGVSVDLKDISNKAISKLSNADSVDITGDLKVNGSLCQPPQILNTLFLLRRA